MRPLFTKGSVDVMLLNMIWVSPLMSAVSAWLLPRYGTCTSLTLAASPNITPANCAGVPVPDEPKFN